MEVVLIFGSFVGTGFRIGLLKGDLGRASIMCGDFPRNLVGSGEGLRFRVR